MRWLVKAARLRGAQSYARYDHELRIFCDSNGSLFFCLRLRIGRNEKTRIAFHSPAAFPARINELSGNGQQVKRIRRNAAKYDGKGFAPRTIAAQTVICCALRHYAPRSPFGVCIERCGGRCNAFSFLENIVASSVCQRQIPVPTTWLEYDCYMWTTEPSQFHDKSAAARDAKHYRRAQ